VEVYPLGPVQLQDPPLAGCGPRSTAALVEVTVALDSSVQAKPPLMEMYGVMAVGVQLPPLPPKPSSAVVGSPLVCHAPSE
jgi:hypothetical protein